MHVLYHGLSIRPPTDLVIMVVCPAQTVAVSLVGSLWFVVSLVGSRLSLWFVVCPVQTAVGRSLERNTYRVWS